MDISIPELPDASSNRFNFVRAADGDVQFDDTEAHEVITSVFEDKGGYWADPNHGSELFTVKTLTRRTPSQVESMALDSLATVVQANEVVDPTATASSASLGLLRLDVAWKTPSGQDAKVSTSL